MGCLDQPVLTAHHLALLACNLARKVTLGSLAYLVRLDSQPDPLVPLDHLDHLDNQLDPSVHLASWLGTMAHIVPASCTSQSQSHHRLSLQLSPRYCMPCQHSNHQQLATYRYPTNRHHQPLPNLNTSPHPSLCLALPCA